MPAKKTEVEKKINDFFTRMSKKYGENFVSKLTPEENRERVSLSMGLDVQPKNIPFKSSHFDEPNILVHLRMNTRTDANGNKVLFLEEVQSDWGQKGKKEGFLLTEKEAGKAWEEADKKYADFMNRMEKMVALSRFAAANRMHPRMPNDLKSPRTFLEYTFSE